MEPGYARISYPWNGSRRISYQAVISNYVEGWVRILNRKWPEGGEAEDYAARFIRRYNRLTRRNTPPGNNIDTRRDV